MTLASTPTLCPGTSTGSAQVDVTTGLTQPFAYAWSDGSTDAILTDVAAGDYQLTVTDANGCTADASVTVVDGDAPTLALTSSPTACPGSATGSAQVAQSTGLTTPLTYLWSNGSNNEVLTDLTSGNYTLTVTDLNGCTATASVNVADGPSATLLLTSTNAACPGTASGSVSIAQLDDAVPPLQYEWNTGATTPALEAVAAGTYTLTVTDGGGCIVVASVAVADDPAVEIALTATQAACPGSATGRVESSVSNATEPISFSWSNGSTAPQLEGVLAGDYTLTVTDADGCTATASVSVAEDAAVSFELVASPVVCAGERSGAVTVGNLQHATAPLTYLWSSGDTTTSLTDLPSGSYALTIVDADGCSATAQTVVEEPDTEVSLTVASAGDLCFGERNGVLIGTAVDGVTPYTYTLVEDASVSSTTGAILGLGAGTYEVVVTDANGCRDTATATIGEHPELTLDLGDDLEINYGDSTLLIAQHSVVEDPMFDWVAAPRDTSMSCDTCEVTQVMPTVTTLYTLTIMDANGCEVSDQIQVRVANPRDVYVPTGFSPNDDGQNDFFYIFGGPMVTRIASFRVFNRWGGVMHRVEDFPANDASYGWDGTLDGEDAASDIYTWMAEIEFTDGRTLLYQGEVMLMR